MLNLQMDVINTAPTDVTVSPFTGAEPAFEQLFRLRTCTFCCSYDSSNFLHQNLV
jgi:hypothetical protein